jgi:hypothetical protein
VYRPINPKAVTRNELYGFLHPTTREWKEGLVSVTFREMANNSANKHQWIVLDGDIDAGVGLGVGVGVLEPPACVRPCDQHPHCCPPPPHTHTPHKHTRRVD